jgi:hypothetical protein
MGDESAMNVSGRGRHFLDKFIVDKFIGFPQHFRQSGAKKLHRAGPMSLAYGGTIIHPVGIIRVLCTSDYTTDPLHKKP